MAKLNRLTAKIFGETASTTNTPKEIGQFGSAKAGAYNATGDVATIQSLPAWSNGWIDAVTPTDQFPPLPEMTGVHKVLSYQNAYLLQQGIPEWDSATTYYTNNFCSKAGKIYISQSDENLNNDPENDTVNWKVFESGGARNIGEIVQSTIPLTDAGLHLLDGSQLQYGSYKAFIDYIADLYDSGYYTSIFETEANWQSAVATYGVCGKFVYDSVNNTVRLPKIEGFIEGTNTISELGDTVEAGLPNITGRFTLGDPRNFQGALYKAGTESLSTSAPGGSSDAIIGFDASHSSSIYGNSSTVQPQSIKVLYYIVIANSTKTDIQVDIDEIATDLNGKADVDLTNINSSCKAMDGQWIVENQAIRSSASISTGTYTFDVSTMLPNDNYKYAVTIYLSVSTNSTNATQVLLNDTYFFAGDAYSTTNMEVKTTIGDVVIDSTRTLKVQVNIQSVDSLGIYATKYRRIGTNL